VLVGVRVLKQPKYYLNVLHVNHLIIAIFSQTFDAAIDAIEPTTI
jgi:hypothetical protein